MAMRVCYFHSSDYPEAVAALPDWAERIDTSASPYAYWEALVARWGRGQALVTVDQDVVLVPGVVSAFANCRQPWCVFPYSYGPDQLLCHSMGCTRFRAGIQWELPAGPLPWNEYDGAVREVLLGHGLPHPHVHYPALRHLHPGLGEPADLDALWHSFRCQGYTVQVGDSDSGEGSDTLR